MWPFKRTLSEQYSKLVKLIKSIDPNFQMTENKEDSLRLHLPNYKEDQPKGFHIQRILVAFLMILPATFVFAQRYSGHGRGLRVKAGALRWNEIKRAYCGREE